MGGLTVSGSTIRHTRGDTGILKVRMLLGGEYRPWEENDAAVLTVKKRTSDSEIVLQAKMEDGEFRLSPEDTEDLKPGTYVYDIQATFEDGTVLTVAGPSKYILLPDVTTEVRDEE